MTSWLLRCFLVMTISEVTIFGLLDQYRHFKTYPLQELNGRAKSILYPYVVCLHCSQPDEQLARCGTGSLISSQWAITAARCLGPTLQYIQCGNMTKPLDETTCKSKVLTQFPHPAHHALDPEKQYSGNNKFTMFRSWNGIALLHVEKMIVTKYARLHVANFHTLVGRAVRSAGFETCKQTHAMAKKQKSEFIRKENEEKTLKVGDGIMFSVSGRNVPSFYANAVVPGMVVTPRCGKDLNCVPGPGGALLYDDRIVGVLSVPYIFGTYKEHPHTTYCVYVPISPYLDWIKSVQYSVKIGKDKTSGK